MPRFEELAPIRIPADEDSAHLFPKQLALPSPSILKDDYCFCGIDPLWIPVIVAGLSSLSLHDSFNDVEGIYQIERFIAAIIEGDKMCCCDDIREQTQRSKYPTAFELLDKLPIAQSELAAIQSEYGTDGSGMVTGASDTDLCKAITAYVRAAAEFAAAREELLVYGYSGVALSLAAGAALALFGILTGGLGLAAGLAIAALGGTFGALTGVDLIAALRDREAQDAIICQLTQVINSATVTRSEYDAALSGLTSENTNEGAIVWALQNYFANDEGHWMLLTFVNQAQDGLIAECAACPEACIPFSMSHDVSGGNVSFPSPLTVINGAYSATNNDWSLIAGGSIEVILRWDFATCRDITHMRIDRWFNPTQLSSTEFSYNDGIAIASSNSSPFSASTMFEWDGLIEGVENLTIRLTGTAGIAYVGWRYVEVD